MRTVRRALKPLFLRGSRGDSSARAAVALAFGLAVFVAIYIAWMIATGQRG